MVFFFYFDLTTDARTILSAKHFKTKCSIFQIFTYRVNKKIPRGPPSPPAPVMHSPNRKVCYLKSSISEQVTYICVFNSASDNNNTSCWFVGHCERTARMEDSTLYLKLEKRQGTEIQNWFFLKCLLMKCILNENKNIPYYRDISLPPLLL